MSTSNASLKSWVEEVARLTKPESIHWCTGSDAENSSLIEAMLASGDLIKLNPTTHPNCYLHRSNPSDVARVEHLTFVCTRNRDDAGPNNHWMDPAEAHRKVDALFDGAMRGRTMYVDAVLHGADRFALSRAAASRSRTAPTSSSTCAS